LQDFENFTNSKRREELDKIITWIDFIYELDKQCGARKSYENELF
jgi:hypothetical protein